jgi:hypothetical protein
MKVSVTISAFFSMSEFLTFRAIWPKFPPVVADDAPPTGHQATCADTFLFRFDLTRINSFSSFSGHLAPFSAAGLASRMGCT